MLGAVFLLAFALKHVLNGQALSACCDLLRESLAKLKAAHWDTLCNDFLACAGHVLRMLMTPLQTYKRQRCQGTLQNVEIGPSISQVCRSLLRTHSPPLWNSAAALPSVLLAQAIAEAIV